MNVKVCLECGESKILEEFCFKNKAKNKRQARCRNCTRSAIRKHYYNNRQYYLAKTKKRNKYLRKVIKEFIFNYLKLHPCIDCGEMDVIVLEFDHLSDKISNISSMARNRMSLTMVESEIKKCEVRCANCHRRRTAREGNWYKAVLGEI